MLEVRVHPRRGRGLYTTRRVLGGETVLAEAPILLSVPSAMHDIACATCLRANHGGQLPCAGCSQASFCSPECAQAGSATPWVHGTGVCSAAGSTATSPGESQLDEQDLDAGRFLSHALALAGAAPTSQRAAAALAALWALQGSAEEVDHRLALRLAPILHSVTQGPGQLSTDQMAQLLRKEQCNSYGILAPAWYSEQTQQQQQQGQPQGGAGSGAGGEEESDEDEGWGRVLRGSALYGLASLINHECNPNVARYDSFDVPGPESTHVVFRAMHDLPPGTEVLQSYCPLAWDYEERQEHCQSVYGFTCTCQRCKLEQSWCLNVAAAGEETAQGMEESSGDWETDDEGPHDPHDAQSHGAGASGSGAPTAMEVSTATHHMPEPAATGSDVQSTLALLNGGGSGYVHLEGPVLPSQPDEGDAGPLEPTYLQLYLLKYVCPAPGCFGTLAPQAPSAAMFECSVCGVLRSEADFMADLDTETTA